MTCVYVTNSGLAASILSSLSRALGIYAAHFLPIFPNNAHRICLDRITPSIPSPSTGARWWIYSILSSTHPQPFQQQHLPRLGATCMQHCVHTLGRRHALPALPTHLLGITPHTARTCVHSLPPSPHPHHPTLPPSLPATGRTGRAGRPPGCPTWVFLTTTTCLHSLPSAACPTPLLFGQTFPPHHPPFPFTFWR